MQSWHEYAESAAAMFVIANPIGALPIFISLTTNYTEPERRRTAEVASITVAVVLVISIFLGEPLLHFFGISLPSFRVAGEILILLTAIAMLQAKTSPTHNTAEETEEAAEKDGIAVVPLGIPLVAGPGAISTIIIFEHQAIGWLDTSFLILICIAVAITVWVSLLLAGPIRRFLGKTGINIVTRILGILLAAVAIEFIAGVSASCYPVWPAKADRLFVY
jgi:multiple antibiotic resistance protein